MIPAVALLTLLVVQSPNIVLVMADDAGVEAFGCYGGESYDTPRIDAMAAVGARFENCHSQPLCTPSRLKIMTGLSNSRNYTKFSIMRPGEHTFAHMLRERGYATAVVGKWQLYGAEGYVGVEGTGTLPADAGFDRYCLWQGHARLLSVLGSAHRYGRRTQDPRRRRLRPGRLS